MSHFCQYRRARRPGAHLGLPPRASAPAATRTPIEVRPLISETLQIRVKKSGSKAQPLPERASAAGGSVGLVRIAVVEHGALYAVRVGPLARLLQRELGESVSQPVITRLRVRVGVGVGGRDGLGTGFGLASCSVSPEKCR